LNEVQIKLTISRYSTLVEDGMQEDTALIRKRLKTPRAAALAGILFSVLLLISQLLIWLSIPSDPLTPASEAVRDSKALTIALNLLPFAGIAFLWFIAVVRDRIGDFEDRFFSTVFLGSGLLYVAMMFISAAIAGAVIGLLASAPDTMATSATYLLGRAEVYRISAVFGTKVAGVFMMSSSTIFLRTQVTPRWLAFAGYVLAVILLLSVGRLFWVAAIFPLWVLLISACILLQNRESWAVKLRAQVVAQS
jgi:hypothetical protein